MEIVEFVTRVLRLRNQGSEKSCEMHPRGGSPPAFAFGCIGGLKTAFVITSIFRVRSALSRCFPSGICFTRSSSVMPEGVLLCVKGVSRHLGSGVSIRDRFSPPSCPNTGVEISETVPAPWISESPGTQCRIGDC